MPEVVHLALKITINSFLVIGLICILAASELTFPRDSLISFVARRRAIIFTLIYLAAISISAALATRVRSNFGLHSFIRNKDSWWAIPAAAFVTGFIGDFFYYWYHRAQHSFALLWRIHAVHHSAEELGAGSGFHHWLEAPLKAIFVMFPAALVISRADAAVFTTILTLQGVYIHSATRLNFGNFALIVSDNRVHRIHHSADERHFDKNFGAFTLVWDWLFGTAYFPNNEWPKVGLSNRLEPKSLTSFLALPARTSL